MFRHILLHESDETNNAEMRKGANVVYLKHSKELSASYISWD